MSDRNLLSNSKNNRIPHMPFSFAKPIYGKKLRYAPPAKFIQYVRNLAFVELYFYVTLILTPLLKILDSVSCFITQHLHK